MHASLAVSRLASEILLNIDDHNEKILAKMALDQASWEKTCDECRMGSLKGPFHCLGDLPFPRSVLRLLLRFAICEQHGGAVAPTCRNIDTGLQGGQNVFVGLQFAVRPADIDIVIALIRTIFAAFPDMAIHRTTSDLKFAFHQASPTLCTPSACSISDPGFLGPCQENALFRDWFGPTVWLFCSSHFLSYP